MINPNLREIARLNCEDDAGTKYTVVKYEPVKAGGDLQYFLADGRQVDARTEDTFEILASGIVIRKS